LIDAWQNGRSIGRYSDVVLDNIQLKLREENPKHGRAMIAPDRATSGAEMLAAAVTFVRRTAILLPDSPVDANLANSALDPRGVLESWTPEEIRALLGRALFDEALYGTVRFHHRTAREYLAARWLGRLLVLRKNRRSVEKLLLARPYGTEAEIVVPSMKPIAAWLAASDQGIRDKIVRIDPMLRIVREGQISDYTTLVSVFGSRLKSRS
jgi:hypothetical protein